MLVTGTPTQLSWAALSLPLQTPREDERLVASIGMDIAPASQIFPGKQLIPIRLNATDLLPGPPAVWESLNAILLDADLFHRITDSQRSTLLAGGVTLAAIGKNAPDARWPWQHNGALWILSFPPIGPAALVDEDAYAPNFNWKPGWSTTVRGQIVGIAMLMVLITIGLLIPQSRWTRPAAISFLILVTASLIVWRRTLGSVDRIGGDILMCQQDIIQRDQWVYEKAKNSSLSTVRWTGLTHPIFSSAAAIKQSAIQLNVSATDELTFVYQTTPTHTMAFMRREIIPGEMPGLAPTHQSPMQDLAKAEYLTSGDQIAGETQAVPERWNSVVLKLK